MHRKFTKVIIENEHGIYSVQLDKIELTVGEVVEDIIQHVLLAAGYGQEQVDSHLFGASK